MAKSKSATTWPTGHTRGCFLLLWLGDDRGACIDLQYTLVRKESWEALLAQMGPSHQKSFITEPRSSVYPELMIQR